MYSPIERGLRKPSADILQQIAKGLRISAEALYVQAGILDDRLSDSGVRAALLADSDLSERQKQVLKEIYESFRRENAAARAAQAEDAEPVADAEPLADAEPIADAAPFADADTVADAEPWAAATDAAYAESADAGPSTPETEQPEVA